MANRARRHIHKYHKVMSSYVKYWSCALPECYHHMPKHLEEMVLGRASICWKCGNNFVIDTESFKMDKPECFNCLHPMTDDDETKLLRDYINSLPANEK